MAAAAMNGCVFKNDVGNVKMKECEENGEKLLNGKCYNYKNGYVKSSNSSNGVNQHSSEEFPYLEEEVASYEKCSLLTSALTNLGLYVLMFLGFVNQLLFKPNVATERNREGYAPLYDPFEQFYSRYVYRRVRHCFNKPVCSAPGADIVIKERETDDHNWSFRLTGRSRRCINLGSYNYLGFGGVSLPSVATAVRRYGLAACSSRAELGTFALHTELEETLAKFLGVEAAMVVGMGFATNVLSLPGLLGPGTLVFSDENNHASLILGLRLSGATVRVFPHNDVARLEILARKAIAERRWMKIVVVVEGVYSMEGSICPLASLVALKRRLRLYLYVDEAHSAGALGRGGRGVAERAGVRPSDVDVLMGTFTKSFGSAGGYIAGSRRLIAAIVSRGHAHTYAHAMAPPAAAQVLAATLALGEDAGRGKVAALRDNTRHFRAGLQALGVVTFGARDSPVVPLLVYSFSKMAATVERLAERGVAVVGVGFPATPLAMARIRFCVSASHSRDQLEHCLRSVAAVVAELGLDYSRRRLAR